MLMFYSNEMKIAKFPDVVHPKLSNLGGVLVGGAVRDMFHFNMEPTDYDISFPTQKLVDAASAALTKSGYIIARVTSLGGLSFTKAHHPKIDIWLDQRGTGSILFTDFYHNSIALDFDKGICMSSYFKEFLETWEIKALNTGMTDERTIMRAMRHRPKLQRACDKLAPGKRVMYHEDILKKMEKITFGHFTSEEPEDVSDDSLRKHLVVCGIDEDIDLNGNIGRRHLYNMCVEAGNRMYKAEKKLRERDVKHG